MATSDSSGVSPSGGTGDQFDETLARLLDPRTESDRQTGEELVRLVDRFPDAAADRVDRLVEGVDAADPGTRAWTLRALATLAADRPDVVAARFDRLRSLLQDREASTRAGAAGVVSELADERPDAVEGAIPGLHALLSDATPTTQIQALVALERLSGSDLDAVAPAIRQVIVLLESDDEAVRERATACVGTCALQDPSVVDVADHRFTDRLSDPVPEVRATALSSTVTLARSSPYAFPDPGVVADAIDRLVGEFDVVDGGDANRAMAALREADAGAE